VIGTPTAIGAGGAERVRMVAYWHPNAEKSTIEPMYTEFEAKFKEEFYTVASWNALRFLGEGISRAKSADPVKVAFAMEGLKMKGQSGEELEMRKNDHALQQGLYIATWTKAGGKLKHDIENTGYTFRTERYLDPFVAATPTSCNMQRPKS
jgi:branched-chain amino acid transport system substrate-binding protein